MPRGWAADVEPVAVDSASRLMPLQPSVVSSPRQEPAVSPRRKRLSPRHRQLETAHAGFEHDMAMQRALQAARACAMGGELKGGSTPRRSPRRLAPLGGQGSSHVSSGRSLRARPQNMDGRPPAADYVLTTWKYNLKLFEPKSSGGNRDATPFSPSAAPYAGVAPSVASALADVLQMDSQADILPPSMPPSHLTPPPTADVMLADERRLGRRDMIAVDPKSRRSQSPPKESRMETPLTPLDASMGHESALELPGVGSMTGARSGRLLQQFFLQNGLCDEQIIGQLRKVEWFRSMSLQGLKDLYSRSRHKFSPRYTTIIREGNLGDSFYVLLQGLVRCTSAATGLNVILGVGASFGEGALITKARADPPPHQPWSPTLESLLLALPARPIRA